MKKVLTICLVAFGLFLTSCSSGTSEVGTTSATDTTTESVDSMLSVTDTAVSDTTTPVEATPTTESATK